MEEKSKIAGGGQNLVRTVRNKCGKCSLLEFLCILTVPAKYHLFPLALSFVFSFWIALFGGSQIRDSILHLTESHLDPCQIETSQHTLTLV